MRRLTQHLRALAPLRKIRIEQLHGQLRDHGSDLTLIYAGNGTNAEYLITLVFDKVKSRRQLAEVSPLFISTGLRPFATDGELLVFERAPLWALLGRPVGDFRMPAWIRQELLLKADDNQRWKLGRHLDREVQRQIRRHSYRVVMTDDTQDKDTFFHELYLPYIRARHALGAVTASADLFNSVASNATLAKLYAGDVWTAGMLLHFGSRDLKFGWFGSRANPPHSGASEVLDALCIQAAADRRIHRINFGNARPSLLDGVVRYKQKFGVESLVPKYPQTTIEWRLNSKRPELRDWVNRQQFLCVERRRLLVAAYPGDTGRFEFRPLPAANARI